MSCLRMVARRGVLEEATLQNWEKTQSKSAPPSPFFSSSQILTLSFRLLLPYCLGFRIYSHPVLIQLSSILIQTFSPLQYMFTLQIVVLVVSKLKACLDLHCNKCVCQPSNYKIIIFVFFLFFLGRSFEFLKKFLFKFIHDLIHFKFQCFFFIFASTFCVFLKFQLHVSKLFVQLNWRKWCWNEERGGGICIYGIMLLWVSFLVWSMFVKILRILWTWVGG